MFDMPPYKIHNLDEVTKKYNKILPGRMNSALVKGMKKAVSYVHSTVPGYPPQPITSNYRRTGQLGRANTTKVETIASRVVGTIGNNTEYAPWVISSEKIGSTGPQTNSHKAHGWYTLQEVVLKARDKVLSIIDEVLRDAINK